MQKGAIPKNFQGILASADINKLDLDKDRGYIIHQILCYGTLQQIKWLFSVYSKKEIVDRFVNHPTKMYPRYIFYFVKNYLLGLKKKDLDEHQYVTSIRGPIRQRAAGSVSQA